MDIRALLCYYIDILFNKIGEEYEGSQTFALL